MYPSSEMLGEFRVSGINNNAEFASAGDITVTSKSGTNGVHGSAFEYLQNRDLDATTYGSSVKQAKVWNTFGGSFSGPVVIPKIYNGHDKTFFFVDYEGNRHPGSVLSINNVPTAAMVGGNLNGVPGPSAVDPSTGAPFPNNAIPASELSPVTQKLLTKYYPQPNFNSGSTTGNYRYLEPLPTSTNGYDIRIDEYLNSKNQLFGRWSWKNIPSNIAATNNTVAQLLPPINSSESDRNLILSESYTITPMIVNEFRFGLSRLSSNQSFPYGKGVDADLGLQGINYAADNYGGFPGFNFGSGTGFTSIGHSNIGNSGSRTFQITDNLSWIKGKHTFKFGFDWRHLEYNIPPSFGRSDAFGSFTFTSNQFTGNAFANMLLGIPSTVTEINNGPPTDEISNHYAFFAQDEYHVTDKLTLSLGLRWELMPPFKDKVGNIANFDSATGNVVVPDHSVLPPPGFLFDTNACPGSYGYSGSAPPSTSIPCQKFVTASQDGIPQGLRFTDYHDFDPRISAAWRPFGNDKTVLRAGWGLYTVTNLGFFAYALGGIATTQVLVYQNYQGPGKPPLFVLPQSSIGNGLSASDIGTQEFQAGTDLHFRDSQSAQWNVTLERQLSSAWTARISYIGTNTYGLPLIVDLNQLPPTKTPYNPNLIQYPVWGSGLLVQKNIGFANYQALDLQINHRLAAGFYVQGTYDWAKNLSNANGDVPTVLPQEIGNQVAGQGPTPVNDQYNLRNDRGNDPSTRRQRLLITGIYQLPFGRGKAFLANANRVVDGVLGGWQLSTVTMFETGPFETATTNAIFSQANLNELTRGTLVKPDQIGSCSLSNPNPNGWFNINGFEETPAGAGRVGNAGVGTCVGPGAVVVSAGLSKAFVMHERFRLRFESTFTNLLNHPNFAAPPTDISTPSTFGVTQNVIGVQNAGNRVGQLSLRLDF
jgi:hypothetical protein